jgi:two-component system response regulator DegU
MRVLIVDDNAEFRRLIVRVLDGIAEVAGECESGSRAVAAYDALQPDCVLMDIRMHGIDGIEATRRIRARHPDAHIVIVTEYEDAELRRAARQAGARAYVVKDDLLPLRTMLGGGAEEAAVP